MPPMYSARCGRTKSRYPGTSDSSQIASGGPAYTSSSPSDGSRLARPLASASPHARCAFSGWKKMGCQPLAISAASSTFFGPNAASTTGIFSRTG